MARLVIHANTTDVGTHWNTCTVPFEFATDNILENLYTQETHGQIASLHCVNFRKIDGIWKD